MTLKIQAEVPTKVILLTRNATKFESTQDLSATPPQHVSVTH